MNSTLLRPQIALQGKLLRSAAGRSRMARNATMVAALSSLMVAAPAHAAAGCGTSGTSGLTNFFSKFGTFLLFLVFAVFPLTILTGALLVGLPAMNAKWRKIGLDMVKWGFVSLGITVLLWFGQKIALSFLQGASGGDTLSCDPGVKIGG